MAKKKEGLFSFVKTIFKDFVVGSLDGVLTEVKDTTKEITEDVEDKIKETTSFAIKKFLVSQIIILGIVFSLVGLGIYLSDKVSELSNGISFLVIGLILIFITFFASYLGKND